MIRVTIPLSDSSRDILAVYKKSRGIKLTNDVVEAFVQEYGKDLVPSPTPEPTPDPEPIPVPVPEPIPEPEPTPATKYNVEVTQDGPNIIARAGTKQLATCPLKADAAALFKAAVDNVPEGGTLWIGEGIYDLSAPYSFGLDPNGGNIFYSSIQVLDRKKFHILGAGEDLVTLRLMPWQRSPSRPVAMILVRGSGPMGMGYSDFSIEGLTIDGNSRYQYLSTPKDGEALILVGSLRKNGKYRRLRLINSPGAGAYLGNNGSGPGEGEGVQNVVARDCRAEGVMLDTNHDSRVEDCQAWGCREGLVLNGNDDWQTRGSDNVTATRFKTDSQITCWQVNDFTLDGIQMDCSQAATSYGLAVRDGNGIIKNSILKSDKGKASSYGGATYIYEAAKFRLEDCVLEGYFGVHAIGKSQAEAIRCKITAPGGCFCTTDPEPVQSTIIAEGCTWSGKKSDIQEGSRLVEA